MCTIVDTFIFVTVNSLCCVLRYFANFVELEFARASNVATQTAVVSAGPLTAFTHDMEPQLRRLGLPTTLEKGFTSITYYYYYATSNGEILHLSQYLHVSLFPTCIFM